MKNIALGLLSIVLFGVIATWGPSVIRKMGEDGQRKIEEQVGIPVSATWKEAVGPGKVLIMNYWNKKHPLVVNVLIQRPSSGAQKAMKIEFSPDHYPQKEIGWMEGWAFQVGDTIHLSSGNYKPLDLVLR